MATPSSPGNHTGSWASWAGRISFDVSKEDGQESTGDIQETRLPFMEKYGASDGADTGLVNSH